MQILNKSLKQKNYISLQEKLYENFHMRLQQETTTGDFQERLQGETSTCDLQVFSSPMYQKWMAGDTNYLKMKSSSGDFQK